MAKRKRSKSSGKDERSKLVGHDRDTCLASWKHNLNATNDAQRTMNLHAVMCEVHKLKAKYSDASVDAVLSEIFPDRSKRARLKRLHEIPVDVLRKAMTTYRNSRKGKGDSSSMCTLRPTHLEFLGVCKDSENRITLLNKCASEGWTVVQLKAAVREDSGSKTVRPLDLAKRIQKQTQRLAELLESVTAKGLLDSVTKVKVRDHSNAVDELLAAAKELTTLGNQLEQKSGSLLAAHRELKRLAKKETERRAKK